MHHKKYRLPYEVEWEYAAMGGQLSQGFKYAGGGDPDAVAWYNTIQEHTHKVGLKKTNEIGLYDMSGNVREWCQGTFPAYLRCRPNATDQRPLRGGSWVNPAKKVKITAQTNEKPNYRDEQSGFRIAEEQ
jgi:formylglycine-generating enzyme